jgi:23S rRNA-/tRNA-specific pseudouridylate synthase
VTGSDDRFWTALPLGKGVVLLNHDRNGLAAFSKPAGLLSHPNRLGEEGRSLVSARYEISKEYFEWAVSNPEVSNQEISNGERSPERVSPNTAPRRLYLLNRLDSATSGVILAASNEALAETIRAQFKKKEVHKIYLALVFGKLPKVSDTWRDRLAVEKRGGKIRTSTGTIPAESVMSVVKSGAYPGSAATVSLIRLEPKTGRSHQLRVQCARRGVPIVGDQTYGDFARNRAWAKETGLKRLFLHSLETRFSYEFGGHRNEFAAQAPLPLEFQAALG